MKSIRICVSAVFTVAVVALPGSSAIANPVQDAAAAAKQAGNVVERDFAPSIPQKLTPKILTDIESWLDGLQNVAKAKTASDGQPYEVTGTIKIGGMCSFYCSYATKLNGEDELTISPGVCSFTCVDPKNLEKGSVSRQQAQTGLDFGFLLNGKAESNRLPRGWDLLPGTKGFDGPWLKGDPDDLPRPGITLRLVRTDD